MTQHSKVSDEDSIAVFIRNRASYRQRGGLDSHDMDVEAKEALRNYAKKRLSEGVDRNDIFCEVVRTNEEHGRPLGDAVLGGFSGTLIELTEKTSSSPAEPDPQSVNQKDREPGKTGEPQKTKESQRDSSKTPEGGLNNDPLAEARKLYKTQLQQGVESTLPVSDYLACASEDQRAFSRAQTRWQSPLFLFVRLAKAHPALRKLATAKAFAAINRVVETWRCRTGERGWQYFDVGREDAQVEFLDAWDKVRYLPGRSPLQNALLLAKEKPLSLCKEVAARRSPEYPRFISLAGWLQVCVGDQPILLPVEDVGELLGITSMTVSRYRRMAVEDGLLKEIRPYEFCGKKKGGRATEFRFDVSLVPILEERAKQTPESPG
jgi:hypothetical protein